MHRPETRYQRQPRRNRRALPREPDRLQSTQTDRNPRHAADERRRKNPVPRAARRARVRGPLMSVAQTRYGLSGLDYFRKLVAGELPPPPMLQLLNIRLVEVDAG